MGRNYYCDYCDKRMKGDIQLRRKHIDGMPHKTARMEHYKQFKDSKEILNIEQKKIKCKKFFEQKQCTFGAMCRFSHYTVDELEYLQQIVHQEDCRKWQETQPKKELFKELVTNFMQQRQKLLQKDDNVKKLWTYPDICINDEILPPSLNIIEPNLIQENTLKEWNEK